MENKTNQIMYLDDNKKYIIINQINYKQKTYYLANEVTEDEQDIIEDKTFLFEENERDGKKYIKIVDDIEIAATILKAIDEQ